MYCVSAVLKKKVTHVRQHTFIKEHFLGIGKDSIVLGWLVSCYFIYDTIFLPFTSITIELNERGRFERVLSLFCPSASPCLSYVSICMKYSRTRKVDLEIALYMRNMHICIYGLGFDFVGRVGILSCWS